MRVIICSLLLLFTVSFFSQKIDERHLHVHFKVSNSFGELTNLIVREVYQDGSKDTVLVEKANHSIDIPINRHVLLEFICPGHVTKRVAFNTDVPNSLQVIPFFDLGVELIEEDFLSSLENKKELKTLMDFPVGYIRFNLNTNNWFNSQLSFTKTINKLIKKSLK
jgi:hypothetical protein|tara:strand:+ start:255 stop:749 length:495 start_codon:yes stop_codon:yes gene_type:complete